ncbi:MAG TPA: DNA cytosine methyltransferase [Ilumatobacteraceae bacterium]|nr:DNA cytosine methyltransferase [Ilumatobacteraceae bacterium]
MQIGNAVPPLLAYHLGGVVPPGPFVDLFCGAGGMSIGFELAGHQLVAGADSDRNAVKAAQANSPDGELVELMDLSDLQSLTRLARAAMKRAPDGLAAVVGGPPCQGFSTAGPCRIGDDRNRLVQTFLSAVKLMEPAVVVMENVPALLWRGKAFLDELLGELDKLGYNAEYALLHTEAYGVPQLRRRLVVQATRTGSPIWPAPTHRRLEPSFPRFQPDSTSPVQVEMTVADAIGDLPLKEGVDLDAKVSLKSEKSDYQRWCRGLIDIGSLVPRGLPPASYTFAPNGRR